MKKKIKQEKILSYSTDNQAAEGDRYAGTLEKFLDHIPSRETIFTTMVTSASVSIVIFQENKFKYVNPSHEVLTGYSKEELLSMNFWDYAHPDFKELIKKRGLARQDKDKHKTLPSCYEYKMITKQGEERWIQARPSYFEYNGKPAAIATVVNITDHRVLEEELEEKVKRRTAELTNTNELLKREIIKRKKTASVLRKRENEIREKSKSLERVNVALSVLLKRREEDKTELEEKILSNVKELIMPYIKKLKDMRLSTAQMDYVTILESHINNIVSPFLFNLKSKYFNLTPREIEIANLVKEGKTTKDIAEMLCCSRQVVDFHRFNIRNKLGLKYKKANLRSRLLSLT